ncbi:MAG: hypothetical protein AAGK04_03580 [Planctomycetota bacterium]
MRWRSIAWGLGALACAAGLSACVTEPVAGTPKREVRRPTPDATPTRLVLAVDSRASDSNGDGVHETILVTAYVFADPRRFDTPYWPEGSFEFRASSTTSDEVPDARWRHSPEATSQARARFGPGPAFVFALSLDEAGADARLVRGGAVQLRAWFQHSSGERVSTGGEATVRLRG